MENRVIANIKTLGIDMIDAAGKGHPGIVLGAAPILYTLYAKHLNVNPEDVNWVNRDRFILSAGHGSALLYATMYMAGFDFYIDDLRRFRKIGSKTPGHPEYGKTSGVEMTTGPLGQGLASAVGYAIGQKKLNNIYKVPFDKDGIVDYRIYVLCGDGDLMEGISNEACSLAGTLKLNNLIVLYDSNSVCLDGQTKVTFTEDVRKKFEAFGWNTEYVKDGTDVDDIDKAICRAKKSDLPTLIEIKTKIGEGSLLEGTCNVHGNALTTDDIKQLKANLKIKNEPFFVDEEARTFFKETIKNRISKETKRWEKNADKYQTEVVNKNLDIEDIASKINIELTSFNWKFTENEATRTSNFRVMKEISVRHPKFLGGAADLSSSTKTNLEDFETISANNFVGRNIFYGVREHAMGAITNGLALTNFRPFCATYLVFADYLKPAIRNAAIMNIPSTFIFTHDSIEIGSDGPTHQPIEQLGMLRSIPNLYTFRPADGKEVVGAWNVILNSQNPSSLILTRDGVNQIPTTNAVLVKNGAYIVKREQKMIHAIILATGSEVEKAIYVANDLYQTESLDIRVISVPCLELFRKMPNEYRESLIPKGYRTIVIEASNYEGWYEYIYSPKYFIGVTTFGASGSTDEVLDKMDFSYSDIRSRILKLLK